MNRRAALVLSGALGFGLGGAIAGVAGDLMFVGFALLGALGAYAISWARPSRKWQVTLAGGFGFFAGLVFGFFVVLTLYEPTYSLVFIGTLGGLVGGTTLGLAWGGGWRPVALFAAAGAVGFGAGFALLEYARATRGVALALGSQILYGAGFFGLAGIVGGALMGLAASTAERP